MTFSTTTATMPDLPAAAPDHAVKRHTVRVASRRFGLSRYFVIWAGDRLELLGRIRPMRVNGYRLFSDADLDLIEEELRAAGKLTS